MTKELKRFEQWWDAEDDIPNNGPYTPDTPIQFAWAGWQAALAPKVIDMEKFVAGPVVVPPELNQFKPDYNTEAVLVEEMQRMAKRVEELEAMLAQRTWVGLTDEEIKKLDGGRMMKEEWLLRGAVVPVDVETTAALVAEIKRLIDVVGGMALKEPVLQDIEQYRLQMAGISTAAIGYWKESDGIHPDYDTLALRDVAKLYAKYDELYKAQDVSHGMIAGALFDFMAWLTSRPKRIMLSSVDDASPAVDAIRDFAKMRGLSLDDAKVQDWNTTPPQRKPLTDEEIKKLAAPLFMTHYWKLCNEFARAIEAKLKERNT